MKGNDDECGELEHKDVNVKDWGFLPIAGLVLVFGFKAVSAMHSPSGG